MSLLKDLELLFLQVLIHSPYEFPEITKMGTSVGVGTETYIAISAQVTKS